MKFTNLKLFALVVLITLSITSAKKLSATKLSASTNDDIFIHNNNGFGNWDDGFYCPQFIIYDEHHYEDQGVVIIYPEKIVRPTGEDEYGMLLKFEGENRFGVRFDRTLDERAAPTQLFLDIVPRDIKGQNFKEINQGYERERNPNDRTYGDYQFRIPYRQMNGKVIYQNPLGNKYIQGEVYDEAGKMYNFKIILPWKLFGWYINDEQGNAIKNAINKHGNEKHSKVFEIKKSIADMSQKYFYTHESIVEITSNKQYKKNIIKRSEYAANFLLLKRRRNYEKIISIGKSLIAKKKTHEYNDAFNALQDLLRQESALAFRKKAIDESVEYLEKSTESIEDKKKKLDMSIKIKKKLIDFSYMNLLIYAPERENDIRASKTYLYSDNKALFEANLNKVYS